MFNDDGTLKETFWFPITPPRPIVIEDSDETEDEREKEEEQEGGAEEPEEEEEATETAEKEEEEAEDEVTEEAKKAAEAKTETEAEEEDKDRKRRRDFNVNEPTPTCALRSKNMQSIQETLQPAPSLTPAPIPSDLFPPLELPAVNTKLQLEIEMTDALVKTSPMLPPVPTTLSPPPSPLSDLDLTMDMADFDKKNSVLLSFYV